MWFSFLRSVNRKPTFTGLYLNLHSFAPKSRKLNLIRCLSYRALNICSDCKIEKELKVIKDIFTDNGYPRTLLMLISYIQWLGSKIRSKSSVLRSVLYTLDFLWWVLLASTLLIRMPFLWIVVIMLLTKDQYSLRDWPLILQIKTRCLSWNKVI